MINHSQTETNSTIDESYEIESALITYSLEDLLQKNPESEFKTILKSEINLFTGKLEPKNKPTPITLTSIRSNFKSILSEFPVYKFNSFSKLGKIQINPTLFKKIKFVKIINFYQLIFFGLSDKALLIYDRSTEETYEIKTKEKINCMDYDQKNDIFVFGHQQGQISFARWKNNNLIFDKESLLTYYSDAPIKQILFVSSCDIILLLNNENKSQILTRSSKEKFVFKVINLLNAQDKSINYDHISITRVQKVEVEPDITKTLIVITLTCQFLSQFVFIEITHEKNEFKGKIDFKKNLFKKLTRPEYLDENTHQSTNLSKMFTSRKTDSEYERFSENSFARSTRQISPKKKCFVVASTAQWAPESLPFFIIVWEDTIERYELNHSFELVFTFRTKLNIPLISGYFGATEYFVGINSNLDFCFIQINKIRYSQLDLPEIENHPDCFELRPLFSIEDKQNYLIGTDASNKGICMINSRTLEYFQVLELSNYIDNLKKNSKLIEIVKLLYEIIQSTPIYLNGVFPFESTFVFNGSSFFTENRVFQSILKQEVANIISTVLDWLSETSLKHMKIYMEICLEMIIKTHNFELLCTEFTGFVLNGSEKNEEIAPLFFNKLISLFSEGNVIEALSVDFFFHIFRFAKNENLKKYLEDFLFELLRNFTIKNTLHVINIINLAMTYKMNDLLFFFFVHDPFAEIGPNLFFDSIFQMKDNCVEDFRKMGMRLLVYVYDVFNQHELTHIVRCNDEDRSIDKFVVFKNKVKNWFIFHLSFFVDCFLIETCWLLNKLFLMHYSAEKRLKIDKEGSITIIQSEKNNEYDNIQTFDNSVIIGIDNLIAHSPSTFFYIMVALRFQDLSINYDFLDDLLNKIANLIFQQESLKSDKISVDVLEYIIYKLIFKHKNQFTLAWNQLNQKYPLSQLKNNSFNDENSLLEFFNLIFQKPYFFDIFEILFQALDFSAQNVLSEIIYQNKDQIIAKSKPRFFNLISKESIDFLFKYNDDFTNQPHLQSEIIKIIENNSINLKFDKKQAENFLKTLAFFNSRKLIDFIESDTKLDYTEKLKICREQNCLRGIGYCSLKKSDFLTGKESYKIILKEAFKNSPKLEPSIRKTVTDIINELTHINIDELEAQKILTEMIVFVGLNLYDQEFKKQKIAEMFARLFRFDNKHLLIDLKKSNLYGKYVGDCVLSMNLIANYKSLTDQNSRMLSLMQSQTLLNYQKLINIAKVGVSFSKTNCVKCEKFINPSSDQIVFHSCRNMVHDVCFMGGLLNKCEICSKKKLSLIIRH